MKEGFRQSMAWLHTWAGLLVCWVLLLMFSAGSASYFREEITLWMRPELHAAAAHPVSALRAGEVAVAALQQRGPQSRTWFISLPDERSPVTSITWTKTPQPGAPGGRRANFESATVDAASGAVLDGARATRGGEFLYRLHFDLHYMSPLWARWIAGFCAMFMLVAIVSGVVIHKRIFKDLFTFRPGKGQRSWLDAHNFTAVLALPYHLMITYTGLTTLLFMYVPAGVMAAYPDDRPGFNAEMFPSAGKSAKASGQRVPLAPVGPMLEQAERHWGGRPASGMTINAPGDANATVSITRGSARDLSTKQPAMQFNGATGALIGSSGDTQGGGVLAHGVMVGLHVAHFASPLLRTLFFISGLAGCLMVASGALLWAVKVRQQQAKRLKAGARASFGLRLVEALNLGAIAGLPIAFASYFWANRLLSLTLEQRAETEINCFFGAWALAAVLAQVWPTRAMWRWQLTAGAVLFAGLPLLNVLTSDSHLGVTLLQGRGPVAVAGFDLVTLALGLALAWSAWRMRGQAGAGSKAVKTAKTAAAAATATASDESAVVAGGGDAAANAKPVPQPSQQEVV